jgi:predicted transposase/invertase (TIGR01784 family)
MQHDAAYKHLFSHPAMIADLLTGYVREDWVHELDFSTLQKMNGSYVSEDLRQREEDVVWRVRWGPRWVYVYLLLEFQSSVDPYMAVRLLTYIGLFYQDLLKQGWAESRLPPVLPIVLYNGQSAWTAATTLAELIAPVPEALQRYQPSLDYWLLDENHLPEEAWAAENWVTALLMLERSQIPEDMLRALRRVTSWLQASEQASLRRAFATWINQVLLKARLPENDLPQLNELSEVRDMLAERIAEWAEQCKRQGQQKGVLQGEAAVLTRLLKLKFGPIPDEAIARIQAADAETLLLWSERVLSAACLDEVFA